jgi:hypothetical protein
MTMSFSIEQRGAVRRMTYPPGFRRLMSVAGGAVVGILAGLLVAETAVDGAVESSGEFGSDFRQTWHAHQYVDVFGVRVFEESSGGESFPGDPPQRESSLWMTQSSRWAGYFVMAGAGVGMLIGYFVNRRNAAIVATAAGIGLVVLFAAARGSDDFFPILFIAGFLFAVVRGAYVLGYRRGRNDPSQPGAG